MTRWFGVCCWLFGVASLGAVGCGSRRMAKPVEPDAAAKHRTVEDFVAANFTVEASGGDLPPEKPSVLADGTVRYPVPLCPKDSMYLEKPFSDLSTYCRSMD